MVSTQKLLSERIAEFVADFAYEDSPGEIIEQTKMAVLDQLGCELIGSTLKWNQIPYRLIRDFEGKPESTIVNYGTKALAHDAAYVNGTFGQGAELDDYMGGKGVCHTGAVCVPVALALGEKHRMGGKEFLTAIIIGYEVAWGMGQLMYPDILTRGFHSQSVCGVFVAAAVAGRLLRLKPEELCHALGIAGSHASGTMEYDQSGGEVKRVHTGITVRNGIQSAMLAGYGLTGPPTIFEGKRGIMRLFAGQSNPEAMTMDLGKGLGMMHNCIKQYPTVGAQQTPIDVLSSLMKEHRFKPEEVERIDVGVNEGIVVHCGSIYEPNEVIQAQFSLPFSLALRLLKGSNDLPLYMDHRLWHDPRVLELAHKVHVHAAPEAKGDLRFFCRMRVVLAGGKTLEAQLDYPKGSYKNPLTREEIQGKFRRLVSGTLSDKKTEEVIGVVDNIEHMENVSQLASLLVKPEPSRPK